MTKPETRAYSLYSRQAALLLGQSIRIARLQKGMTAADLAERSGLSRGLVNRIEAGDPGCSIGAAFEAAAVVGVTLFDSEGSRIADRLANSASTLKLLPKAVRAPTKVKDDF